MSKESHVPPVVQPVKTRGSIGLPVSEDLPDKRPLFIANHEAAANLPQKKLLPRSLPHASVRVARCTCLRIMSPSLQN